MSKTALRAALAGAGVGGFHVAANFTLPDYFAFTNFTGYLTSGGAGISSGDTSSLAPLVMMTLPSMMGGMGFVAAPVVAKMLPQSIKDRLKIKAGGGSAAATGQEGSAAAAAGDASAASGADQAGAPGQDAQAAAAAAPPAQAGPSPEELAAMVEQAVGKKIDEATADMKGLKAEFATFQSDVVKIKQDVQNLTASLETSLTDLKAFQAEMVNPLNFMRKYFEALDIKSLSDPTQTLPQIEIRTPQDGVEQVKLTAVTAQPAQSAAGTQQQAGQATRQSVYSHESDGKNNNHGEKNPARRGDNSSNGGDAAEPLRPAFEDAFGHLLGGESAPEHLAAGEGGQKDEVRSEMTTGGMQDSSGGGKNARGSRISLGKLMSMVSVLDKITQDIGPDNIELMIEYYRQFGLSTEDEMAIYNIVNMMKDFDTGPEDIVVKLYKLGQVIGIKDQQADLEYAKIMARIKSRAGSSQAQRQGAKPGPGTELFRRGGDDSTKAGGIAYG